MTREPGLRTTTAARRRCIRPLTWADTVHGCWTLHNAPCCSPQSCAGPVPTWLLSAAPPDGCAGRGCPRDLDVAVTPEAVTRLVSALADLRVPAEADALIDCRELRFATGWGPLDVFIDPPPSGPVLVEGVPVAVETLR